eukprot:TRINITY_DN24892_c0_g1_i1.p1 TRINITY_DN24892_c0_g1~~TRINITY_DN24892_c0_g1_i1.p1  ORF type:complete len:573 (+),score=141.77 TRINITY_DN24892_c0_g1_i1:35-1720(+)
MDVLVGLATMEGLGSAAVAHHFCCAQRPRRPEQRLASILRLKVRQYCTAVEGRRECLAAVDRFYRDLMTCQWRIDAIEARRGAVRAALKERGSDAGDQADQALLAESAEACLIELVAQQEAAVSALEERASHYALGVQEAGRSGRLKRYATSETERQSALGVYRQLAVEVFQEACAEVRAVMGVPISKEGLQRLGDTLDRRLAFWDGELEETWSGWHEATSRMHDAGLETLRAWREVAEVLEAACQYFEQLQDGGEEVVAQPELQSALVTFAARSLEVELINSLGLSGLSASQDGEKQDPADPDRYSLDSRLGMLISVLELLSHLGLLDRVGEEILIASAKPFALEASYSGEAREEAAAMEAVMPTPTSRAAASLAKQLGARVPAHRGEVVPSEAAAVDFAAAALVMPPAAALRLAAVSALQEEGAAEKEPPGEGTSAEVLLPWLAESLIEAVSTAAETKDLEASENWRKGENTILQSSLRRLGSHGSLLRSCATLGSTALAEAVQIAAERRRQLHQCSEDLVATRDAPTCGLQSTARSLSKSCSKLLDLLDEPPRLKVTS